jgi:chemotaxis protein methyltransferase CheR
MATLAHAHDAGDSEMEMLLDGIHERYGYDFTHYSRASLKRRVDRALHVADVSTYAELLDKLFHDERCFDEFLRGMSITVTEMFRDPAFYRAVREKIVPVLKTFPFIKIWHAGCATGEEIYSMAILLEEEGFLDRTYIYATDFNKHSLDQAQEGVYAAKNLALSAANYAAAGGKRNFSDYYTASYDFIKFKSHLKEHVTFSYHNLVTDGVFGEMNVVCCRNVMIYFDKVLQDSVLLKFTDSLRHGGFLCLGNKETLNFTSVRHRFEPIEARQRIYRRCG